MSGAQKDYTFLIWGYFCCVVPLRGQCLFLNLLPNLFPKILIISCISKLNVVIFLHFNYLCLTQSIWKKRNSYYYSTEVCACVCVFFKLWFCTMIYKDMKVPVQSSHQHVPSVQYEFCITAVILFDSVFYLILLFAPSLIFANVKDLLKPTWLLLLFFLLLLRSSWSIL